jgi:hypothetical protein
MLTVTGIILLLNCKLGGFDDHGKVESAGTEGHRQDCLTVTSDFLQFG